MDIAERQNSKNAIRLLKAQRQLYSDAKIWWRWDFVLTVVVTSIISSLRVAVPSMDLTLFAGIWAVVVTLLSLWWISPTFRRKQAEAASIQEEFDCDVLGIAPAPLTKKVPPDKTLDLALKYDRLSKPESDLLDWYPRILSALPDELVTASCQRINARWDDRLRSLYTSFLVILLVAFALFILGIGTILDKTIPVLLLSILLPLLPALGFLIKQLVENSATIHRLKDLEEHSQKRLDALMSGEVPVCNSREIQNEVFLHRKNVAMIPDWFFRKFRSKEEQSMRSYAAYLLDSFETQEMDKSFQTDQDNADPAKN